MADLKVTKFVIDGQNYVIPDAADGQKGLMSGEDFNKLAGMTAGAEPNKIDSVKVNGVALNIASKAVDILIKESTENGKLDVQGVQILIHGLAALAFKAQVSQADLDTALDAVIKAKAEQSSVNTINSTLETLQGSGEGSIKSMINSALNTFATETTENGVIDKFAEMVQWFAEHGDDASQAAQLLADMQAVQAILAGIGGKDEPTTVKAYVAAEIEKLNLGQYVTTTKLTDELKKKVDVVEGKGLSEKDFTTALYNKLNGIADGATKNTVKYDSATQTLTLTGFAAAE